MTKKSEETKAVDKTAKKSVTEAPKTAISSKAPAAKAAQTDSAPLTNADFVHLHNHTYHSLLDGLTKIGELVDFVKASGMQAVAITDHGTMSGLLELYKACQAAEIKSILGLEAYVAARRMEDRDPAHDKVRYHITLLAMNNTGYQNLCKLSSEANLRGIYYRPRIDHETMAKYSEGIICLSGCAGSEISEAIKASDMDRARKLVEWYHATYGDRFYLEMQDHGHPDSPTHWEDQTRVNAGLQQLAKEYDLPLVITCDGHYLKHEDQDAHEVLLCVGTGSNLSDNNRMTLKDFELHVIPPADIIERWGKDFPDAIRNTRAIADRCSVELTLGQYFLPKFDVPEGETETTYLSLLVYRGLTTRYGVATAAEASNLTVEEAKKLLPEHILERAHYELSTIDGMGFDGYFLIVQDFINWGKSQGIVFGPGRGSGAGSIVAYALRITDLDPLAYGLLFERFLNPDRISMPDFDTDIQDTRRDEVIKYCTDKYGAPRVANICTLGKMMGKMAVRDVARVLEVPYAEADTLAKLVPDPVSGKHVHLSDAISDSPDVKAAFKSPDLKREYDTNPRSKEVIDYARKLEGTIRSHGVHACGVVIAPDDLVNFVPLEMAQKGVVATQLTGPELEDLGLLKMDFLGLSNLSVIQSALRIIKKVYKRNIDIYALPLDDKPTYELLQRAETTGVFQLESAGMKKYLRDLKPDVFEDIIAMVALYRPGPLEFIPNFIKRKHGHEKITYLHPGLENALKNTYGVLVYQEQFMQISREWCGFTGGESDTLRKAVGKKKIDLMMKMKPQFLEGAVKVGGATKQIAETFWNQLEAFANYCFNKSHAACYAMVAYWTAYLKAHYPDAFMAALMTSDYGNTDRLAIEISECKHMGLKVLNPDINQSYGEFAIVGGENKIRFGLAAVKGVGKSLIEDVIAERDTNGKFASVFDFARRVNSTKFNKKAWESVIKAGGFDSFGFSRSDLLFNLEKIQAYGNKMQKEAASGQTDMFGALGDAGQVPEPEITPAPSQAPNKEQLLWERELLGLYISSHPLDDYETYLDEQTHPFSVVTTVNDDYQVSIGGIISAIRVILTKSGTKMAFIRLEGKTDEREVIVFPGLYEEMSEQLVQDAVICVTGRVNAKDKEGNRTPDAKVIAENITVITDDILKNYQPTGEPLPPLSPKDKKRSFRRKVTNSDSAGDLQSRRSPSEVARNDGPSERPAESASRDLPGQKLYILVRDPEDTDALRQLRSACDDFPGRNDVILVLGADDKRAMKLPFRVDPAGELLDKLESIFDKDCVKLK
jgi:DNA polymerase-3 subunit alpha